MKRPSGRNEPPFLIVGGPADGKQVDTETDHVLVPKSRAIPVLQWDEGFARDLNYEVTEYRKQFWVHGRIAFFVPVNSTIGMAQAEEETLRLLIQGYHQPKETT